MGLARWSKDCSVYVYVSSRENGNDLLECCGCDDGYKLSYEGMLIHLKAHVAKGHKVPDDLMRDIADMVYEKAVIT